MQKVPATRGDEIIWSVFLIICFGIKIWIWDRRMCKIAELFGTKEVTEKQGRIWFQLLKSVERSKKEKNKLNRWMILWSVFKRLGIRQFILWSKTVPLSGWQVHYNDILQHN